MSYQFIPPGQNGHFAGDLFICIFVNEKFCVVIEISLKFVPNKGPLTIIQHWFIRTHADAIHWRIYTFYFQNINNRPPITPRWRHEIETFSALLGLYAPVTDGLPTKDQCCKALMFYFGVSLNKLMVEQWSCRWFENLVIQHGNIALGVVPLKELIAI